MVVVTGLIVTEQECVGSGLLLELVRDRLVVIFPDHARTGRTCPRNS